MYSQIPQNTYYQYPYGQQYQRPVQLDPSQYNIAPPPMPQLGNYIKGRPVASFDEARAAQIDFDGSLHVFTDIGNKRIYTKQINMDGTATLHMYALVEEEATPKEGVEYVTKAEFNQMMAKLDTLFQTAKETEKKVPSVTF